MSLHLTNMTDEPLLLTVLAGDQPHERIIYVSPDLIIFDREPLQQQSLPTGGRDPIEIRGYQNGWHIGLYLNSKFAAIQSCVEFGSPNVHAIAIKIFTKVKM
ncbi:MAG: hypothetical protein V1738_02720 [Patescibacteria group bacterium]